MATRKRRTTKRRTARRRPVAAAANPVHRRRRSTASRRRAPVHASTHRRRNPSRRRYARRNPGTGLIKTAAGTAIGMAGVGLLQMFVPPIGGASPIAVAARQAGTGWLAGEAMRRFGILPSYANDVKVGGAVLGVATLINAYVMPTISGFFRPAPKAADANGQGMGDIVTLPRGEWDPYYGSTPSFNTNPGSGMSGVVTIPRRATGY